MQTPEGAGSGLFRRAVELHLIGYEGERYQNRGAISFRRFIPNRNQMRRDLVVWDPSLDYDGSVATWTAAPPQVLEEGNAEHSLWFGSRRPGSPDGSLVWPLQVETPGEAVDQRLLEDTAGAAALLVSAGSTTHRSALIPYEGKSGAPPSRGAVCVVRGVDGRPDTRSDCSITDGDFTNTLVPPPCRDRDETCKRDVHWVSIDLQTQRPIGLVALRGCSRACRVEFSTDEKRWTPVRGDVTDHGEGTGPVRGSYLTVSPSGSESGRYVRVTAGEPKVLDNLAELSVW